MPYRKNKKKFKQHFSSKPFSKFVQEDANLVPELNIIKFKILQKWSIRCRSRKDGDKVFLNAPLSILFGDGSKLDKSDFQHVTKKRCRNIS